MKVLAVATSQNPGLWNWTRSLEKYGYDYKILGMGEPWKGFQTKLELFSKELRTMDPQAIVIVMDAYDALAIGGSPKEAENKFLKFGKPIVSATESLCAATPNPLTKTISCYPKAANSSDWWKKLGYKKIPEERYPNSGFLIGRARALQDLFEWGLAEGYDDDQYMLSKYIADRPELYAPDLEKEIIDCASVIFKIHIPKESACFAHFPGTVLPSRTWGYNRCVKRCLGSDGMEMPISSKITGILLGVTIATFIVLIVAIALLLRRKK